MTVMVIGGHIEVGDPLMKEDILIKVGDPLIEEDILIEVLLEEDILTEMEAPGRRGYPGGGPSDGDGGPPDGGGPPGDGGPLNLLVDKDHQATRTTWTSKTNNSTNSPDDAGYIGFREYL